MVTLTRTPSYRQILLLIIGLLVLGFMQTNIGGLQRYVRTSRPIYNIANVLNTFYNEPIETTGQKIEQKGQKEMSIVSGSSSEIFQAKKVREFPENARIFRGTQLHFSSMKNIFTQPFKGKRFDPTKAKYSRDIDCKNWAVLTTIFEPTEAVRRLMYTDWCLVIVGDEGRPSEYKLPTTYPRNFVFLRFVKKIF